MQFDVVLLQVSSDDGRATSSSDAPGFPSPAHPLARSPAPPPGCYQGRTRRLIAEEGPSHRWLLLRPGCTYRPTPREGRQEAEHRPSDPLWWPFLSPRCLTGRKDAVCCPPAPLTCSPLVVPTRENTLLIPDSSLALPCSLLVLLPPPHPPIFQILLFVPCRLSASCFSSPCCQHPLRPIAASPALFSFV